MKIYNLVSCRDYYSNNPAGLTRNLSFNRKPTSLIIGIEISSAFVNKIALVNLRITKRLTIVSGT